MGSETNGFSGYRQLYADALKWTGEGWIDYVIPQLYFPFNYKPAPYEKLVDWWSQHANGRHLYIGHASYRVANNSSGWENRSQLPNQIRYLRKDPNSQGSVFYSSKSIAGNLSGIRDSLQYDLYRYKSLPPTMAWLDDVPPLSPAGLHVQALADQSATVLNWLAPQKATDGESAFGYVIYRFNENEEVDFDNPRNILYISYDSKRLTYTDSHVRPGAKYVYVVTALDRIKNESRPSNRYAIAILPDDENSRLGK